MGQGEDLPLVSPAGLGTTEALSFVTKQCVALTHSSCVCSAGCPNISLLLLAKATLSSGETAAVLPDKTWPFTFSEWQINLCHPRWAASANKIWWWRAHDREEGRFMRTEDSHSLIVFGRFSNIPFLGNWSKGQNGGRKKRDKTRLGGDAETEGEMGWW